MIDIVEVRFGSLIVTLTQSDSLLLTLQPILTGFVIIKLFKLGRFDI